MIRSEREDPSECVVQGSHRLATECPTPVVEVVVDTVPWSREDTVIMMNVLDRDLSPDLSRDPSPDPSPDLSTRVDGLRRDHEAAIPLYVQLREELRRDIRERGLEPGDRLPTELELQQRYGVSRSTIRQAVGDLETEGVVRRIQGKGTFVTTPKIQHVPVLTSFSELLRSQGHTPSHRLLTSAVVPAPPDVARGLGIDEGALCRHLKRLFAADGEPVGVSETWLPLATLGPLDAMIERCADEDRSLYELLESEGVSLAPHRAVETINPGLAEPEEARLLGCEPGTALLSIHRSTRTAADQPLEWTRLRFVGGRYEYRVELHRPAEPRS